MPLTDTAIRNAEPAGKPYKLTDGGCPFLLVNPTGSRLWRLKYRIPLPPQALAVLRQLHALTGTGADAFVFPCIGAAKKPISENTLNAALRRLGFGPDVAIAHGFRATATTLLNECGRWNPDAIERQLAHAENNRPRREQRGAARLSPRRTLGRAGADDDVVGGHA